MTSFEGVLDGRTVGLLDRWRKTRSLFLRADTPEAERALSDALEGRWTRAQIYGRARRILVERAAQLLADLELRLGDHAARVRVAPEDQGQTKWDAIGNLMPLSLACRQIRCLWLVDVLQQGQLSVEFQPIFDLRTGEALGYEGLLRGRSPDGTRHLAEALFPAAHVLGIEEAFERVSWAKVLDAGRRLPEDSLLFLNVNPMLLVGNESGLAGLGREAERMEFPYARLALDLVEVERVESLERLSSALDVPHDLGVAIALDDVKSSYGLLKYCAGLTPRWVKVDSEITRGIARDPQRRAILQLLSQVTRGARAGLIAEGIESGEDLDVCVAEGVFAAQGYFLARPAEEPGEASPEFRLWLDSRGGRVLPFEAPGASARRALAQAEPEPEPEPESQEPPPRSAEAERDFELEGPAAVTAVRLDVWLDVACVYPTRTQAKAACEGGKVDLNGSRAKAHREVRVGDRLTVSRSEGVRRELVVRGLAERSLPKAQARKLYDDVTPAPPPQVVEARRLDRLLRPQGDAGRPDKRERRERRKLKGW